MNYANYVNCDLVNGEGIRCSLWVSGCAHHCEGCFNKEAWKFTFGKEYTREFEDSILSDLHNDFVTGLSLLGGEPLHPRNIVTLTQLCKRVKKEVTGKDIMLWTGYTFEEVNGLEVFDYIDIIIDGKYEKSLPTQKLWRGSDNQRLFKKRAGIFVEETC